MYSLDARIRKVKCDETKPSCQKFVKTGRTCDGYGSPFRYLTSSPTRNARGDNSKSEVGPYSTWSASPEISSQDIEGLNSYFSTKTMFDVKLGCDQEARQILQASLTDPAIRNAILSLRTLREDFEIVGDGSPSAVQHTPSHAYGLQWYNMALGDLASKLSSPDFNGLRSVLLCCQTFISIEQVMGNYDAMVQHITLGFKIMHDFRARPYLVDTETLMPAHHDPLPFLDVFIIKLFAAPCKFAESSETGVASGLTPSVCPISPHQESIKSRELRAIAPNKRTELTRIAASTLDYLNKVSQIGSIQDALQLVSEKAALLASSSSWLTALDSLQMQVESSSPEPLSVSFLRLFQLILRVVLLESLHFSPYLQAELGAENNRLQGMACVLGETVRAYRTCNTSSGRGKVRRQCGEVVRS